MGGGAGFAPRAPGASVPGAEGCGFPAVRGFDAVWLYLAVVSGAPWYFPAAGVCMLGAMLFAAVQNIRYARRKRPPVIAETVQAKKRKHVAKH